MINKYSLDGLIDINSITELSKVEYIDNICNNKIALDKFNDVKNVSQFNSINIFFNINNNIDNECIKKINDDIVDVEINDEVKVTKVAGLLLLIPIYNQNYDFYINRNLSTITGQFDGVIFNDELILKYVIGRTSDRDGVIYEYNKVEDTTYIKYNPQFVNITNQYGGYDIKIDIKDRRDLYVFRGDTVDTFGSYNLLRSTLNSNEI